MKPLYEQLRDTEVSGIMQLCALIERSAMELQGLHGDYANLKAERDALSAELAALREQEPVARAILTDAELKLIMSLRKTKENYEARIRGHHEGVEYLGHAVFASPKEDFKDWPEDRGEHPQKGLGK
jgi:hypothetical protein